MNDGEKSDALRLFNKGWTAAEIGEELGRDESTIYRLINETKPTTEYAGALLKARASELVGKLLEKAEASHILDILSRPNIGVLEPAVPRGAGGQGGGGSSQIIINVQPSFLAAAGPDYGKELPEVSEEAVPVRDVETTKIASRVFSSVRQVDGEPA